MTVEHGGTPWSLAGSLVRVGAEGRSGEGDGRGRSEAEALGLETVAGGLRDVGLVGRLRCFDSDSSVVGSSVGWSPTVATAGAVVVAGVGAET